MSAARALGVEIVPASEEENVFERVRPGASLTLPFADLDESIRRAVAFHREHPIDAVVPVDERSTVTAAALAQELGLRGNSVEAVRAAGNKLLLRERMREAGVPAAGFRVFLSSDDPAGAAEEVAYPCVLKPARLAASRGVMRADDAGAFAACFRRLKSVLERPDVIEKSEGDRHILVEEYLPGVEVALDGMLSAGRLRTLAVFDKPDPLEGPFFEETIYVTPSRLPRATLDRLADTAGRAAAALGLSEGPVHAEMRINESGIYLIEMAARSIGGLCSGILKFPGGQTLEQLILAHATGGDLSLFGEGCAPAGVMMLPIPRSGTLREVGGVAEAKAVSGIDDCVITAVCGRPIEALPEGGDYLGFLFASGPSPEAVEASLRAAHGKLSILIE